jgi:hypothetical protein
MRYEVITALCYSLRLRHEAWFRITYEVSVGPRPGITRWFLVRMEELGMHNA